MSLNKFTIQKSFAINAGAGSGKTYTLSRRYINALLGFDFFREEYATQNSYFGELKPVKVSQIVTITYTEAAALEMKGRIFELVKKILDFKTLKEKDEDYKSIREAFENISKKKSLHAKKILEEAYKDSGNSRISTIHSYCLNIIKANSDIARFDTKLDIIKEDEKANELSRIIFTVLNDEKNQDIVLDISKNISTFFLNNLIGKYVSSSKFRKDYDSFDEKSIDKDTYKKLIQELYLLPNIDEALSELEDDKKRLKWFKEYHQNFLDFDACAWRDVKEDKAPTLGVKKFPFTTEVKEFMEGLISHYSYIDQEKERQFFEKIEKIKTILHKIKEKYDERLTELGKIDFDTIITKTLELMPRVRDDIEYMMVDEFQDTNMTQFEIVKNSNAKNIFAVGDSKQSIYSFQGAEIEVFNNAIEDRKLFESVEDMGTNYRSDGVVLKNINIIFEELLKKDENLKLISQNYEATPQNLKVSKSYKEEKGSFRYLITSQAYQEEKSELDTIASFVADVCYGKNSDYGHITELVEKKEQAIAILFDSSTKMLELKEKLKNRGISAKVSTSDNFFHTKEINDIYNLLRAVDILSNKKELKDEDRYFVVGAMRSNILRVDDDTIKKHLDNTTLPDKLKEYVKLYRTMPLSEFVKFVYDDSNLLSTYVCFNDIEQRVANLEKFLTLCYEYQDSDEPTNYRFFKLLENSIYFSEAKEDEAFFKSDNTKSVEICSIHSTKGLAYPLVLLGNSDKGLYSQITSDALKHNNFTCNGSKKEIVGFKIEDYTPLSHRVLKQIDKLKHLAEKKRLLYVALTRAKHDIVISAHLKQKKDGGISLREDSYLNMICNSLHVEKEELFEQNPNYCIEVREPEKEEKKETIKQVEHSFKLLSFEEKKLESATSSNSNDTKASRVGTISHKIIELYWDKFSSNKEAILDKMLVFDESSRDAITLHVENFCKSEEYELLKSGVEHKFELEFHHENRHGFIDFIYFDEKNGGWVIVDFKTGSRDKNHDEQLRFYKDVMENLEYKVCETKILWI